MSAKRPEEAFDAEPSEHPPTVVPALRALLIAELYGSIQAAAMELARRQGHLKAAEDIHGLVDQVLGFRPRT